MPSCKANLEAYHSAAAGGLREMHNYCCVNPCQVAETLSNLVDKQCSVGLTPQIGFGSNPDPIQGGLGISK